MLLGLQSKAVHVDTHCRDVGVVLVRLHQIEVCTLAHLETVVAVQLQQSSDHGVLAGHALHAGDAVAALQACAVPPVGVVEGLLTLVGANHVVIAAHEAIALHDPDQLLHRVVEVQLQLVAAAGDALAASELQHINQVLVAHLGELPALIGVQVDVVHIQGGSHQASLGHAVADHVRITTSVGLVEAQVVQAVELQVDAHLVVLQSNQGQSQARVAAEPELQGDVQSVHGGAAANHLGGVGLTTIAQAVAISATLVDQVGQLGHVTHHLGVAGLLARLLGQLIPDVQPVTIMLINALATDLQLHIADQVVAHPVQPPELGTAAIGGQDVHAGQSGLQVNAMDQIAVTLDSACHLLAEVGCTVEGVLNGLHSEVSVPAVHHLKKSNLGVASQVNILGTISYELHQATTGHFVISLLNKKNSPESHFCSKTHIVDK